MNVEKFLSAIYRCATCRHHLGFSESCVEGVRGHGAEGECPGDGKPCDKWEPAEGGPYASVSPTTAAFAQRLAREAEAFDKERRVEAWFAMKCFTDGRIAQEEDRQEEEDAK